jgi:hypothetical protein
MAFKGVEIVISTETKKQRLSSSPPLPEVGEDIFILQQRKTLKRSNGQCDGYNRGNLSTTTTTWTTLVTHHRAHVQEQRNISGLMGMKRFLTK